MKLFVLFHPVPGSPNEDDEDGLQERGSSGEFCGSSAAVRSWGGDRCAGEPANPFLLPALSPWARSVVLEAGGHKTSSRPLASPGCGDPRGRVSGSDWLQSSPGRGSRPHPPTSRRSGGRRREAGVAKQKAVTWTTVCSCALGRHFYRKAFLSGDTEPETQLSKRAR